MKRLQTQILLAVQLIVVTLMVVMGYVVAPVLFAELSSKVAGDIAGSLFELTAITVMVCLIMMAGFSCYRKQSLLERWHWLVSLVIMVVLYWGITPWMQQIKSHYPLGLNKESVDWGLFASLHGVYQLLYLCVIVLMLFGIFRLMRSSRK